MVISLITTIHVHSSHLKRFVSQYHPKHVKTNKEQNAVYLRSRLNGFLYLLESGCLDSVSLMQDQGDDIIKLMDTGKVKGYLLPTRLLLTLFFSAAVIKMEGGSDDDLLSLDQTVSDENGDKSLNGSDEKRDKAKESEFLKYTH